MSRRRFVREIKSKEVKNINPSDIIYLAMKDGSIILITDDDEDLIEYDDIKLYNSFKRKRKYYNKKLNTNNDDSLYEFETEKNYKTNTNSYKTLENILFISSIDKYSQFIGTTGVLYFLDKVLASSWV